MERINGAHLRYMYMRIHAMSLTPMDTVLMMLDTRMLAKMDTDLMMMLDTRMLAQF